MPPLLLSTTSLYARVRKIHYRSLRRRLIQYLKLWFWFIIMPIANSYDGILCMIHHRDIYLFKKNYYELNGHFFYDVDMCVYIYCTYFSIVKMSIKQCTVSIWLIEFYCILSRVETRQIYYSAFFFWF